MPNSPVFVTGLGLVTALGPSSTQTWERLLAGQSGLRFRQPFPALPVLPLGMIGKHPTPVTDLLHSAIAEAITDAKLALPLPNCGVVIGSSRSFQGQWEALARHRWRQGELAPQSNWLDTLPHMGAIAAARQMGSSGPVLAPMAACATGLVAIFQGAELIRRGQCQQVLVGAVESPLTPLTLTGFQQMGAFAPTGCYPFSPEREGLVLAEGAAVLVLESEQAWRQRAGVEPYGQILGSGLRADAHHVTAPDPQQQGSRLALNACLERSGLQPSQVDYIHAHGTGTRLNDAHESRLVREFFPSPPALSSTKGATGHALGASGAIGVALCALALRHQYLPPNVGLVGKPIYPNLVQQAGQASLKHVLCLSFGFGGQNAALALGEP